MAAAPDDRAADDERPPQPATLQSVLAGARGGAKRVLVLGGGVAGLSAAHELVARGYRVTVVERGCRVGGKARSIDVEGSGTRGRPDLPGEHGFRFFPGFYRHLTDTMSRIAVDRAGRTAADNLVAATMHRIARDGQAPVDFPTELGSTARPLSAVEALGFLIERLQIGGAGLTPADIAAFVRRVVEMMTMCPARAERELEARSWWEFIEAEQHSQAYREFFATALTKSLLAAKATEAAARPAGLVLLQLIYSAMRKDSAVDRVLNGPTSAVWLEPWREQLQADGVEFLLDTTVLGFAMAAGRIAGVQVKPTGEGPATTLTADHYVAAMPAEVMMNLLTRELVAHAPSLAGLRKLGKDVEWMNGVLFFLDRPVPMVRGHVTYINSEWSLTSISQSQFWPGTMTRFGNGDCLEILSVCLSDWDRRSSVLGQTARQSTYEQITAEVWRQIKCAVNVEGRTVLADTMRVRAGWIDTDIVFTPPPTINLEPLLVNKTGRWAIRPEAHTAIPNFFLASDYVRSHTNLATMEGANEAARRAVNAILVRDGRSPNVDVWPLHVPESVAFAQKIDCIRHGQGASWIPDFRGTDFEALAPLWESAP